MIRHNQSIAQTSLPEADPLHQACQTAQERHHFFRGPIVPDGQLQPVVVAVSGGVDSVTLLHVLSSLAPLWQITLHVAHLDHNLRPESADDAHFVAQLADQGQWPFHQARLTPAALADSGEGIEAAGRHARYRFLTEVALAITPPDQCPVIALAHHADDQAETLLLHLVRGSGLRGLGGMRAVSQRRVGDLWPAAPVERAEQTLHLVRPFLGVQRADLLRYVRQHNLSWREDSTNQDQRFVRNRLRHTVLPALTTVAPTVVQTLTRTAELLQQEADRLAALDQETLVTLLLEPTWSLAQFQAWRGQRRAQQQTTAPVRVVLAAERLCTLSPAAQRGVLREAYSLVTQSATVPDFAHSDALVSALQRPFTSSGPHSLLADVAWSLAGAAAGQPARFSLHRTDVTPFSAAQPFLDEAWRATYGCRPLPMTGTITLSDGWQLTSAVLTRQALPTDWRKGGGWQVYLDADQVGQPALTTPQPGHRFAPLGMAGQHKSVGDFFTDRKVPVDLRRGWPLIVDQATGEVLWISGYQPSHQARVTEQTQRVLWLAWQQGEAVA